MVKRLTPAIVPLLAVVILAGCAGPEEQTRPTVRVDPESIQAVPIIEQRMDNAEGLSEPTLTLIESAEELEALGAEIPLAEQVNFDEQDLAVFALGQQSTGGYWVKITGARRVGDVLKVEAVLNSPGDDEMVTQQITYPYAAAILPKTGAAEFVGDYDEVTGRSPDEFPVLSWSGSPQDSEANEGASAEENENADANADANAEEAEDDAAE